MRAGMLLIALLLFAATGHADDPKPDDWTGQLVVSKTYSSDVKFGDVIDGKPIEFPYHGVRPRKVLADRGGRLRVFDGHNEGWVDKNDFIPSRDAVAYFSARIDVKAGDTYAWWMRGKAWARRGEYDNAIKDFTELIRLDPTDTVALLDRGNAYRDKRDTDRAIRDFDEAIRLDPTDAIAFNNRGNAYQDKRNFDRAIRDFDEAIRLDSTIGTVFFNRGNARKSKRDYDGAIRDYDEAVRLNPKYAEAYTNRGNAYQDKQDPDRAIRDFDEAIRLEPTDAIALNNRGNSYSHKKDHDRAIRDFDKAIRLDPKFATAFFNRGNSYRDTNDFDHAVGDYDAAIRLGLADTRVHFHRAIALIMARKPGAVAGFRKVLAVDGYSESNAAGAVILGHLAARQAGDGAAAKAFLADAAGKLKDDWPVPVVQYLRGDIDAAKLLALAADTDTHTFKQTDARCYLGLDLLLKGDTAAATTQFRWVKEKGNKLLVEYTIAVAELGRLEAMKP
jgi:tetratricopeptide (TPR) repeat protein